MAASFFNKVNIIATIGDDFPKRYIALLRSKGIGLEALKAVKGGKTFRWKGSYDYNLNSAKTIYTHLNVFSKFDPEVPETHRDSKYLFLANIDPDIQQNVLRQMRRPRIVACDSMNYWIENKRKQFERLLGSIDVLLLNDAEARQFTREYNLIKASRLLISLGPKIVVIKKGEHGVIYFSRSSHFVAPAYLLENIYDPTGAGDTFAEA